MASRMTWNPTIEARRARLLAYAGVTTMVDVGANTGQYATELRRYGYPGAIYSYEPVAAIFETLARRAATDPTWTAIATAVGAKPGRAVLHVAADSVYSSLHAITRVGLDAIPDAAVVSSEAVVVDTLDHLCASMDGPIGVKLDVQGTVSDVMDGGQATLARAEFLEVELSLVPCYEGDPLYRDMLSRICDDLGFELALTENVWPDPASGRALQINGLFLRGHGPSS
jgi:FkbM family methyltransferase